MPLDMVHADKGDAHSVRERLRGGYPDEERADKARADRHSYRVDIRKRQAGGRQRLVDYGDYVLYVRARGDLGHNAAILRVQRNLRGHHTAANDFSVLDD